MSQKRDLSGGFVSWSRDFASAALNELKSDAPFVFRHGGKACVCFPTIEPGRIHVVAFYAVRRALGIRQLSDDPTTLIHDFKKYARAYVVAELNAASRPMFFELDRGGTRNAIAELRELTGAEPPSLADLDRRLGTSLELTSEQSDPLTYARTILQEPA